MGAAVKPINAGTSRSNNKRKHQPRSPIDKAKGYEVVWSQVSGLFEIARSCDKPCFVYLIGEGDDGPLKIGRSNDPIARLRGMQTGNPRRLRVEYVVLGDLALEKLLHELWEPFAIFTPQRAGKIDAAPGTEWFKAEVRGQLLPIMNEAASRQMEYLCDPALETYNYRALERIVRDAHAESGFVAQGRDEIRLMATNGADFVIKNRASRI